MSADLLITALIIDNDQHLDFDAGDRAIGALEAVDVIEGNCFIEHDPDEDEGLEQIRVELRSDLRALREAIDGYLEITEMHVRGAVLYITGGMSTGEGPTEVWDVICRLRAVRGVLTAVGFEREGDEFD